VTSGVLGTAGGRAKRTDGRYAITDKGGGLRALHNAVLRKGGSNPTIPDSWTERGNPMGSWRGFPECLKECSSGSPDPAGASQKIRGRCTRKVRETEKYLARRPPGLR